MGKRIRGSGKSCVIKDLDLESKLRQTKMIKQIAESHGYPTQLIEKSGRKRNVLENVLSKSKASLGSPEQRKMPEQKDWGTSLKRSMGPFSHGS